MTYFWIRISGLWLLLLTAASLIAQKGGAASAGANNIPTPTALELIVHGSVTLPDGVVPGRLVRVDELCKGQIEATTYADSKGHFSVDLGLVDRELASYGQGSGPAVTSAVSGAAVLAAVQSSASPGKTLTAADMKDCSIRASLSGYRPQSIPIEPVVKNQNTTLGELQLHSVGKQESALMSATDNSVPKNARKDYEKALDETARLKRKDAIAAMEKATSGYSKFATAWLDLGLMQSAQKDNPAALRSFTKAIAADDKFAPPYVESAVIEAASGDWSTVLDHTNKAITLAPDLLAGAYYLNAMANVHLNQMDAAQKSVEAGLRIDEDREYPDFGYIDGVLLMSKGDVDAARKRLEAYLELAPNGTNAGNAKQLLAELPSKK